MKLWILVFTLVFQTLLVACYTTSDVKSTEHYDCERKLQSFSEQSDYLKFKADLKQKTGYLVSYSASASGFVVDAVMYIVDGVVKTVVYCPAYVVSVTLGAIPLNYCDPKHPKDKVTPSNLGQTIFNETKEMRDLDYSELSTNIREVSACLYARNNPGDRISALKQLQTFQKSDLFLRVRKEEKLLLEAAILQYSK